MTSEVSWTSVSIFRCGNEKSVLERPHFSKCLLLKSQNYGMIPVYKCMYYFPQPAVNLYLTDNTRGGETEPLTSAFPLVFYLPKVSRKKRRKWHSETLQLRVRACPLTTNFGRSAALDTIFSYVPLKNLTLHLEEVNFSKKLE